MLQKSVTVLGINQKLFFKSEKVLVFTLLLRVQIKIFMQMKTCLCTQGLDTLNYAF